MVWHALRLDDALGIYVGKNGPTARMRAIGGKLAACWNPAALAEQVSSMTRRDFQSAWRLLNFTYEVSKRQFEATLALIDWARIEKTIGNAWSRLDHDIEVFLQVCFQADVAKEPIRAMVMNYLAETPALSVRLAMLAPLAAVAQINDGKLVGVATHGHFHCRMSAGVIAQLAGDHDALIEPMIAPHEAVASKQLGSKNQPFFDEPLLFLRLIWQLAPTSFERIMANVDPSGAEAGWRAALSGKDAAQHAPSGDRRQKAADRQTAAWLIERCVSRSELDRPRPPRMECLASARHWPTFQQFGRAQPSRAPRAAALPCARYHRGDPRRTPAGRTYCARFAALLRASNWLG